MTPVKQERDSFSTMLSEVNAFHQKHQFKTKGGEDMVYRLALMTEELGEIAECVTKGKPVHQLAEECADLMILLMGNAIAADFDLNQAFWDKMKILELRQSRIIDGRIRVSAFEQVEEDGAG